MEKEVAGWGASFVSQLFLLQTMLSVCRRQDDILGKVCVETDDKINQND